MKPPTIARSSLAQWPSGEAGASCTSFARREILALPVVRTVWQQLHMIIISLLPTIHYLFSTPQFDNTRSRFKPPPNLVVL